MEKEPKVKRHWTFWAALAIPGLIIFVAFGGFVVQQLWNWLMPTLFGLPEVTLLQALGIVLLSRILFGGIGAPGRRRRRRRRAGERWEQLTLEERERLLQSARHNGSEVAEVERQ